MSMYPVPGIKLAGRRFFFCLHHVQSVLVAFGMYFVRLVREKDGERTPGRSCMHV